MEKLEIELSDPMLYDRLHTLSAEYSVSVELLVNLAVRRLVAVVYHVAVSLYDSCSFRYGFHPWRVKCTVKTFRCWNGAVIWMIGQQ